MKFLRFLKNLFFKTKIRDLTEMNFHFDIDLDDNLTHMECIPESNGNISMVLTYDEWKMLWRKYDSVGKCDDIFIKFNNYIVAPPIVRIEEPCRVIDYEKLTDFVRNNFEFEFEEPGLFQKIEQVLKKFDNFTRPITVRDLYYDHLNYHAYIFMRDNGLEMMNTKNYHSIDDSRSNPQVSNTSCYRLLYGGSILLYIEYDYTSNLVDMGNGYNRRDNFTVVGDWPDRFSQKCDLRGYLTREMDRLGRVNKLTDTIYKERYRIQNEEASREGLELYNSAYRGTESYLIDDELPLDVKELSKSLRDFFRELLPKVFLRGVRAISSYDKCDNWYQFIKEDYKAYKIPFFYDKQRIKIYGRYRFTQDEKYIYHQSYPLLIEVARGYNVKLIKVEVKDEWKLKNEEFDELLQTLKGYFTMYEHNIGKAFDLQWDETTKFYSKLKNNLKYVDEMVSKVVSEI